MAEAVAALVLAAVVVSLGFGLLLYWGVRAEAGGRERMSRADAEQVARRDTDDERSDG